MEPLRKVVNKTREQSLGYVVRNGPGYIVDRYSWPVYRLMSDSTFLYQGESYEYFIHPYNRTWKTPRGVEIPICREHVKGIDDEEILEVGNVLSHYIPMSHTVIDKYESGERVVNADVMEYDPERKYELVVCISTLEHIGYDTGESVSPDKPVEAARRMMDWVADDGLFLATIPYDYNPYLDEALEDGRIGFSHTGHLRCRSRWNEWTECTWEAVTKTEFGDPYPLANGLTVGYYFG